MRLFRKNQVVITTLAALLAVAGYLNHVENLEQRGTLAGTSAAEEATTGLIPEVESLTMKSKESDFSEETHNQSDEPQEVIAGATDIESNEIEVEGEPGEAVLVNAMGTVDFIVEAKLAREEVRANSKDTLMEIVNNSELSEEEKSSAVDKVVELTENAEKESAAEALIEAKGYENVVVTITDEGVDVMVVANELDNAARAQIEEIVKTKAGVEASQITITAVKDN